MKAPPTPHESPQVPFSFPRAGARTPSLFLRGLLILSLLLSGCSSGTDLRSDAQVSTQAQQETDEETADERTEGLERDSFEAPLQESDRYDHWTGDTDGGGLAIAENNATAQEDSLSFSLKVDTAAYANVTRYLESGRLPPGDAVRTEELINYFSYGDVPFRGDAPFGFGVEMAPSPFHADKTLAMIQVQTPPLDPADRPNSNLTFLIDSSGSMDSFDKLPLLQEAFRLLTGTLSEEDHVSIVTYAGDAAVLLDSCSGADEASILSAIDAVSVGGGTAGADGLETAYQLAQKNFDPHGNNRVILATDGDFNIGPSSATEMEALISEKRESGIYLSVLGLGRDNPEDALMETLSKNGNGNYAHLYDKDTAEKLLVEELGSNLYTVAEDVKAQLNFNPALVTDYRLIGYENRSLGNADFRDDTEAAGEVGAGSDLVLLLELGLQPGITDPETPCFTLKIRYKDPGDSRSQLLEQSVTLSPLSDSPSPDFSFAAAVAGFGHLLRNAENTGELTLQQLRSMAEIGAKEDERGSRQAFLDLLDRYASLTTKANGPKDSFESSFHADPP